MGYYKVTLDGHQIEHSFIVEANTIEEAIDKTKAFIKLKNELYADQQSTFSFPDRIGKVKRTRLIPVNEVK